jgi:hypothetical protein
MKATSVPVLLALLAAGAGAAPIKVLKLSVTNPAADARGAAEDIVAPRRRPQAHRARFRRRQRHRHHQRRRHARPGCPHAPDHLSCPRKPTIWMATASGTNWPSRSTWRPTRPASSTRRLRRRKPPYNACALAVSPAHRGQFASALRRPGMGIRRDRLAHYFDKRNAIDLYGKRRPGLYLDLFASPGVRLPPGDAAGARHLQSGAHGAASARLRAVIDGQAQAVAEVGERQWRVLASGPVRSVGEIEYKGWKIGGRTVDLVSRFTQWAGEHGFHHRIAIGDSRRADAGWRPRPRNRASTGWIWRPIAAVEGVVATWGHQVVAFRRQGA